jgi:16S rRNA (cytosine967-C5)-methyltransferase
VSPAAPGRPAQRRPAGRRPARPRVDSARLVAYETLRAVSGRDAYANLVLPGLIRKAGLHGRDAGFATELAYGALRGRGSYDAVIGACLDRPLDRVDPELVDVLRLGAHQLFGMRVPVHAAVGETVELARRASGPAGSRFANAVLRKMATRELEDWFTEVAPDPLTDPDGYLAVVASHPQWMVRALRDSLGAAGRPLTEIGDLLAADNRRPVPALAALPGLATAAELVADGASPGHWSPIAAGSIGAPGDLVAVAEGRARVQDEGSQLVTLAFADAPVDGDAGRWLDLCAGPGGKAALLGALLGSAGPAGGRLTAVEVAEHRVTLVRDAVRGVLDRHPGVVEVRQGDGREVGPEHPGEFDRVLVDAPCTGLGALRRRPEARWRRTPADLAALRPLQHALLTSALEAVRPGGVVGYATCSPHPAETRLLVSDVLRRRDDVERVDARELLPDLPDLGPGPDVQLWPHLHGTDAMYLALVRRTR